MLLLIFWIFWGICAWNWSPFLSSESTTFSLCQEMSIWRDSLTVGWWLEDEMLLGNWKPDRLTDRASDRTVGVCRMGICAVICVCVCISANVARDSEGMCKCLRQGQGFNLFPVRITLIKRLTQMDFQSKSVFYLLLRINVFESKWKWWHVKIREKDTVVISWYCLNE